MLKLSGIIKEVELKFIKDSYFGIDVPPSSIKDYEKKLKKYLGDEYETYKKNKDERDGSSRYHITIISSSEYRELKKNNLENLIVDSIDGKPELLGIGMATNNEDVAYYVVVQFKEGNDLRASLGLKEKDFHVTLGFKNKDVHNTSKNEDTIILK